MCGCFKALIMCVTITCCDLHLLPLYKLQPLDEKPSTSIQVLCSFCRTSILIKYKNLNLLYTSARPWHPWRSTKHTDTHTSSDSHAGGKHTWKHFTYVFGLHVISRVFTCVFWMCVVCEMETWQTPPPLSRSCSWPLTLKGLPCKTRSHTNSHWLAYMQWKDSALNIFSGLSQIHVDYDLFLHLIVFRDTHMYKLTVEQLWQWIVLQEVVQSFFVQLQQPGSPEIPVMFFCQIFSGMVVKQVQVTGKLNSGWH